MCISSNKFGYVSLYVYICLIILKQVKMKQRVNNTYVLISRVTATFILSAIAWGLLEIFVIVR